MFPSSICGVLANSPALTGLLFPYLEMMVGGWIHSEIPFCFKTCETINPTDKRTTTS